MVGATRLELATSGVTAGILTKLNYAPDKAPLSMTWWAEQPLAALKPTYTCLVTMLSGELEPTR